MPYRFNSAIPSPYGGVTIRLHDEVLLVVSDDVERDERLCAYAGGSCWTGSSNTAS
jgi:hypothetical protein